MLVFICGCSVPRRQAMAQALLPQYACVVSSDAYFYATRDDRRGLFLLPESYYVKVLESDGEYSRAEYLFDDEYTRKLVGYIRTDKLAFVEYVPAQPYFYHLFEVSYTLENGSGNDAHLLDRITLTCSYYGDYTIGSQTYCYVLREGTFGYIPKPQDLIVTRNTEYDEWLRVQEEAQKTPLQEVDSTSAASPTQIALLICVCLLIPILSAFILRSSRRPTDPEE